MPPFAIHDQQMALTFELFSPEFLDPFGIPC